ncbi:MAG: ATP-binding cassette domain-containing protein [Paludibacteraceae bacterium]|nr:ATP-binding cassette domain-containing protein [Paludibacteraceae bacterium]
MISIEHLTIEFSARPVLSDISFLINRQNRIGLVGKNGAGKTTLLRLLAGEMHPTAGNIAMQNGISIGYLPQQMIFNTDTTVIEETRKAFAKITNLEQEVEQLQLEISRRTDYESADYASLIDEMTYKQELLQLYGSSNFEGEMEKTLLGLGFLRSDFDRPCDEFSGGWRMRIELAKILLQRPDLLLLDEPTNHLDIESIQWLEEFLQTTRSAVLLVSHDRAFLDNVTTRTIEITLGRIYDYDVPYSKFVVLRQERHDQQVRAYENQQKMIQETEDFIERFRYKATKAVQVQSRIKQLEKLERLEVDLEDTKRLHLRFPPAPRSGDYPVIAEDVRKAFGQHLVFEGVTFTLKRGDKVAFVGKNGEGKTTLVKCIMQQLDHDGSLRIGHNVQIGYFAQNQASLLDGEQTVFDTIDRVATGDIRLKIRDILGAFMFGGDISDRKVKFLSGGERSRLAMIRLLLQPVNLLILDEPTNHLDMPSKDVLKEAIQNFNGTVIIVSHDRYFLDGLVDKVYEFGGGKVREHLGGIYDFLQHKKLNSLEQLNTRSLDSDLRRNEVKSCRNEVKSCRNEVKSYRNEGNPHSARSHDSKLLVSESHRPHSELVSESDNIKNSKIDFQQQKERKSQINKLNKQIGETEAQISDLEQQQKDLEAKLSLPENQTDTSLFEQYNKLKHTLEQKLYEWELLQEQLSAL